MSATELNALVGMLEDCEAGGYRAEELYVRAIEARADRALGRALRASLLLNHAHALDYTRRRRALQVVQCRGRQ